jgi:hypothetical protein
VAARPAAALSGRLAWRWGSGHGWDNRPEPGRYGRAMADDQALSACLELSVVSSKRRRSRASNCRAGACQLSSPIGEGARPSASDLDQITKAITRTHLARRAKWQLVSGPSWIRTGLVYVQPDGSAWHPDTVTKRFDDLVEKSGLPPIRLHDLRHCAATFLKAAGADLDDIKEMLGHSTITITSDTYTSVIHELETERAKAEAAAALVPRAIRRTA